MDCHCMQTRYKQAKLLFVMREFQDALEILNELLRFAPANRELLTAKSKCLTALGRKEEAAEVVCKCLSSDQQNSPPPVYRHEKSGSFSAAS